MPGKQLVTLTRQRLSLKRLREWLIAEGPQTIERVVFHAKQQIVTVTVPHVEQTLSDNPELFFRDEDGLWCGRERQKHVVVAARPRPQKKPPRKPQATAKARRKKGRPREHGHNLGEPIIIEAGSVACFTYAATAVGAAAVLESGRHILVPFPQRGSASAEELGALVDAFARTPSTEVYEVRPLVGPVYRGRRSVVQARPSPDGLRVHIVFGPGEEDEGYRSGLISGPPERLLLPSVSSAPNPSVETSVFMTAGAVQRALADALELPDDVRDVIVLPAASRAYDRAAANAEITRWLETIRRDGSRWNEFAAWVGSRKTVYDPPLMQALLERALNIAEHDPVDVLRLTRAALDHPADCTPSLARSLCIRLSDRLSDSKALEWAKELIPIAEADGESDVELDLAAARIAIHEDRSANAANLLGGVFANPDFAASPGDLDDYLYASLLSGQGRLQLDALGHLDAALARCATPDEMRPFLRSLGFGVEVAEQLPNRERTVTLLERQILLLLELRDEALALKVYETRMHPRASRYSVADRLGVLSTLTRCEDRQSLEAVLSLFFEAVKRDWDRLREPARRDAVADIRYGEYLIGASGQPYSRELAGQLTNAKAATGSAEGISSPLTGSTIVVMGGRPRTRERVIHELKRQYHPSKVEEIPPSWEASVTKASVRSRISQAQYVVEVTDCIKHDASMILRELESVLSFRWVRTSGGTTRILRDLVAFVAKQPA